MVDTKTVTRREISYANLDEVVADAERLVAAGATTSGNWSLGQILEHVATVMDKSIDGFDVWPPLPVRLVGRWFLKNRFLKQGMPAGFQLKGPIAKELLPPEVDAQQAFEHLRTAVERLKADSTRAVHPFFGKLTWDESNRINCRHAELHMSFIAQP
ncbi:MAG: DUF1569 domain-containing protein [Bythopirellula sp.]